MWKKNVKTIAKRNREKKYASIHAIAGAKTHTKDEKKNLLKVKEKEK